MIQIVMKNNQTAFRPGDRIRGRIHWELPHETVRQIQIKLLWHTMGKGDRDLQVVDEQQVHLPQSDSRAEFEFTAPGRPYSFSSKLITLTWAVEAVAGESSARVDLCISPTGEEVQLQSVAS